MASISASQPSVDMPRSVIGNSDRNEVNSSGVSWAAVVAGGFVSAALSLSFSRWVQASASPLCRSDRMQASRDRPSVPQQSFG